MAAAEIRDHETGLVSGPFSWFQSRQIFLETNETETNPILPYLLDICNAKIVFGPNTYELNYHQLQERIYQEIKKD